jgi:peptidyl-prolyl cis-trans isomerase D
VNKYDLGPDLNDEVTKDEITELVFQKGKFDLNRSFLEKIQKKEFDNEKFNEISANSLEYASLNSINDNNTFETNSVKMIYSLPVGSLTLVNDKDNKIYLVKIVNAKDNSYNIANENYLKFVQELNTDNRKSILQSYDQLLNNKYKVQLNQKTIDRVKNYFK